MGSFIIMRNKLMGQTVVPHLLLQDTAPVPTKNGNEILFKADKMDNIVSNEVLLCVYFHLELLINAHQHYLIFMAHY
jgi:hypothetical protein